MLRERGMTALPEFLEHQGLYVALRSAMEAELPKPIAHITIDPAGTFKCTFQSAEELMEQGGVPATGGSATESARRIRS